MQTPYDESGSVSPPRTILHVDMDAFFAAIEQRDRRELQGRPVLIGGTGPRAVVSTASYEARPFGCHSAQPMAEARRRCPHAAVVKPRGHVYRDVSQQVFAILENFTPTVEPLSIDEAFMDVTGSVRLFGGAVAIAQAIRQRIRDELSLTASVGVAPSKFVAKLASDVNKPDGMAIVEPEALLEWLRVRPIETMWGVGPASLRKLEQFGIRTFGDLHAMPDTALESRLGSSGIRIKRLAMGLDPRPVTPDHAARSISHEQTFGSNICDPEEVRIILMQQAEMVARRLRRHDLASATITVKIRFGDYETITRSTTLDSPTSRTDLLWNAARSLFDAWANQTYRPVRLIGLAARVARHANAQLALFGGDEAERAMRVDSTTDVIVQRFGKAAITRAAAMRDDHHAESTTDPNRVAGGGVE